MTFNLGVTFTNDQLAILYATGTNVVVAKPSAGGSIPNVAWLVFKALPANKITWDEEYGIYASTQNITNGATLTQLSSVPLPAADNKSYTLQIYNFLGRKVKDVTEITPKTVVNVSELVRGIYIFQLKDPNGRITDSGTFQINK